MFAFLSGTNFTMGSQVRSDIGYYPEVLNIYLMKKIVNVNSRMKEVFGVYNQIKYLT